MIATLSRYGGRRYPQFGNVGVLGIAIPFPSSGSGGAAPVVVTPTTETVRGWHFEHWPKGKKRLTKEELLEAIRQQRIDLGILPPDPAAPQAIPEPEAIAREVADAVNDQVVMADLSIDYRRIYKLAFMEAEMAIAEYKRAKDIRRRKVRRAVGLLMIH